MLTPEDAREAYQSSIPARHEEFKDAVKECLRDASQHSNYQTYYVRAIMRTTQKELRARLESARDRVRTLIDSGWTPQNSLRVRDVYSNMFSRHNHWNRDSFTDLNDAIEHAHDTVGLAASTQQLNIYALEFGQYQVDVSTEFGHDLEFYMAAKQPNDSNVTNLTLQGNVGFIQTGGVSNVTQNIGSDVSHALVDAMEQLRQAVERSNEQYAPAITDLVDNAITVSKGKNVTGEAIAKSLDGVQNLIRTTAAVPTAYNFLVAIAASHGIILHPLPTGP